LAARVKRYLEYAKILASIGSAAPARFWGDYQPKFLKIFNPNLEKTMTKTLQPHFENSYGVVIGGNLSWKFNDFLKCANKILNVDVVKNYPGNLVQPDYLADAANLYFAKDSEFDFVCSSHVLEHLANPVKAIKEWIRVIKKNGVIYCAIPDKRFTFDHRRKRTSLKHLMQDYQNDVSSKDLTHLNDMFFNYDYRMAGLSKEQILGQVLDFYAWTKNGRNALYQPHHHVFVKDDLVCLFECLDLKILFAQQQGITAHVVAQKQA
jgi:predicted SAM-dependent methyltransferase